MDRLNEDEAHMLKLVLNRKAKFPVDFHLLNADFTKSAF